MPPSKSMKAISVRCVKSPERDAHFADFFFPAARGFQFGFGT